ncbi:MAG: leucine-rich repeat protein [archaeon]|nr:leucine-rich repeat protein [archaeon]
MSNLSKFVMSLIIVFCMVGAYTVLNDTGDVDADTRDQIGTLDTDDGYTFVLYSDKTATIKNLTTQEKSVVLAKTVTYEGEEYTVTHIAGAALRGSTVTSVTIPNTIVEIEKQDGMFSYGAFEYSSIENVFFEENSSLEKIGYRAFAGCIHLSQIELPSSLKEIDDQAFGLYTMTAFLPSGRVTLNYADVALTSIHIPASVEKIGLNVFPYTMMDITVDPENKNFCVENGMLFDKGKTFLYRAFDVSGDVSLPDTLETVGDYAFRFLTKADYPESAFEKLGITENPIHYEVDITKVTIPDSVKAVGKYAFNKTTFEIAGGNGITTLDTGAFNGAVGMTSFVVNEGCTVAYGAFTDSGLKELIVKDITGNYTFSGTNVERIVFSADTIAIGNFSSSSNLTTVTYDGADEGCSFILPPNVKTVPQRAFDSCSSLTALNLSNIVEIEDNAFYSCTNVTDVVFGDKLTKIGSYAFYRSGIDSVVFPASLEYIGQSAFYNCSALAKVEYLGEIVFSTNTFSGCKKLNYTDSETGVVSMQLFKYDSVLSDQVCYNYATSWTATEDGIVKFPSNLVGINPNLVSGKDVKGFVLGDNSVGFVLDRGVIYNADKTVLILASSEQSEIVIPESIVEIGNYAFSGVKGDVKIDLDKAVNLKVIGDDAFYHCDSIKTFNAPATLEKVGSSAFSYSGIESASFRDVMAENFEIGSYAFSNTPGLKTVLLSDNTYFNLGMYTFQVSGIGSLHLEKGHVYHSFESCANLKELYFGRGVDYLWQSSIQACDALETVWIMSDNLEYVRSDSLPNNYSGLVITPLGSENDYSSFSKYARAYAAQSESGKYLVIPIDVGMTVETVSTEGDDLTVSFTLNKGYTDSVFTVFFNGVAVELEDGVFTFTLVEGDNVLSFEGIERDHYTVTVEESPMYDIVVYKNETLFEEYLVFQIVVKEGYAVSGLSATVDGQTYLPYSDNFFAVRILGSGTVHIDGVSPETYYVTFIENGRLAYVGSVEYGQTLSVPGLTDKAWYVFGSDEAYDFTEPIVSDTEFYNVPVADDTVYYLLDYTQVRGDLTVTVDGKPVTSGSKVAAGSEVDFVFDGGNSFEITGWYVNGEFIGTSSKTLAVVMDSNISVMYSVRYFQGGYEYIIDSPIPTTTEEIKEMLWIGSYNDPLTPSYNSNMPKGYVAVDDYLFMVIDHTLYKLDLNGELSEESIKASLQVDLGANGGNLCYANGYLFELGTKKVFDTDLNLVTTFTSAYTSVKAYGDSFVASMSRYFYRFDIVDSVDADGEPTKTIQNKWSRILPSASPNYGIFQLYDGYLYYIVASTSSTSLDRALSSIDLETGVTVDTFDLNPYHYGHYYDDGWLTLYDGYLYLASYTSGLFGETNNGVDGIPKLVRIAVDKGNFVDESVQYMVLQQGQKSGVVVYNDRGYVNGRNGEFVCFDAKTFEVIYTMRGADTHGGIVVDTAYSTPENNYKVLIYIVPYTPTKDLIIFEDSQGQTEGKMYRIENVGYAQYATTAIRASASGNVFWFNDSSIFFIYGHKDMTVEFFDGKDRISVQTGLQNGDSFAVPDAPSKAGFEFVGWVDAYGNTITSDSKVNGMMSVYAMWAPAVLDVTFVVDGEVYAEESVAYGGTVTLPKDPVKASDDKSDYVFAYWSVDGKVFDGKVTADTVAIAVFDAMPRTFTVTVVYNDGTTENVPVVYGDMIDGPRAVYKYYRDSEMTKVWAPTTKIYRDITVYAVVGMSGSAGADTVWEMDFATGTLTISGTGATDDWTATKTPWYAYRNLVTTFVVDEGVTYLGAYACYKYANLSEVVLSDTLEGTGKYAVVTYVADHVRIGSGLKDLGMRGLFGMTFYENGSVVSATSSNLRSKEFFGTDGELYLDSIHGTVGDVEWTIDCSDRTLTVCGQGSTGDWTALTAPWYAYRAYFENVVVEDGVTEVGDFAFYSYSGIKSIVLSDTVVKVGKNSLRGCGALEEIVFGGSLATVGSNALYGYTFLDMDGKAIKPVASKLAGHTFVGNGDKVLAMTV